MNLRKVLKRWGGEIVYRLRPDKAVAERPVTAPEFHALGPGDIAIDCGANLGAVTDVLSRGGAEVHAFEPNPDAFRHLAARVGGRANVHLHPKAVHDHDGRMQLYFHLNYARNPERFSAGSSLIGEKRNVDETGGIAVEVVDLAAFVQRLGRPVKLVKIDVEGAEYAILEALIARGVIDRIERVFVETHAHAIPSLAEADRRLRATIAARGLGAKIDLNWI
jgi:FkbM family methyltransferase